MHTTLHFIRHADAVPTPDTLFAPGTDYDDLGLSPTGVAQAHVLAQRLARVRWRPVAVYASPTRRAHETAAAIGAALGTDIRLDPRLREVGLGPPATGPDIGQSPAQAMRERLSELAAIAIRDGSWNALPDAEPSAAVRRRMAGAVDEILARHRGCHVALVAHAGSINACLASVVGTARDFFFLAGNTSISSVRYAADAVSLIRLNDTAHLETLERAATTP